MSNAPKAGFKQENAHREDVWCIHFDNNGNLYSGSLDGTVKKWDIDAIEGFSQLGMASEKKFGVTSLDTSTDGDKLLIAYQDGLIRIVDTKSLKSELFHTTPGLLMASGACFSKNANAIYCGTHSGTIDTLSAETGEQLCSIQTSTRLITALARHDDRYLAAVSIDGYLKLVDLQSNQLTMQVEAHAMHTRSVAFSTDGNLIYTASDDRQVALRDMRSGGVINSFSQSGMAYSVDASNDGRHFIVGCSDHSVSYWDLGMQRCVHSFDSHRDQVWSVRFGRGEESNHLFASAGQDCLMQTYNYREYQGKKLTK